MDLYNYSARKQKGLIEMEKAGNDYLILSKKFDPLTGEPLGRESMTITQDSIRTAKHEIETRIQQHEKEIERLRSQLPEADALLADMAALDKTLAAKPVVK